MELDLECFPLTQARWSDLERLFGPRGACGGCWCMYWLLPHRVYQQGMGEPNRFALHDLAGSDPALGLLAYAGGEPVGWCAFGPRERYTRLEHSRVLARVDDQPVWSVVCFYVAKAWRRKGITVRLLHAACSYAAERGAHIIEGYPVEPAAGKRQADALVYTGLASAFVKAGFQEAARRSPTRPIMRYIVSQSQ